MSRGRGLISGGAYLANLIAFPILELGGGGGFSEYVFSPHAIVVPRAGLEPAVYSLEENCFILLNYQG